MRSKVKSREKWRTKSRFLLHGNALVHRSVLVKDFLAKNDVTTLELPHTLPTWLQLSCTCSFDWNQRLRDGAFFYATDIIKNATEELKRRSQNGFQEFFKPFTVTGRKYSQEIFLGTCSLNSWTVLYFSEIKWFREYFEATTLLSEQVTESDEVWGKAVDVVHTADTFRKGKEFSFRYRTLELRELLI
jgi:hypothetical protein